jgi:hypothetical protein
MIKEILFTHLYNELRFMCHGHSVASNESIPNNTGKIQTINYEGFVLKGQRNFEKKLFSTSIMICSKLVLRCRHCHVVTAAKLDKAAIPDSVQPNR